MVLALLKKIYSSCRSRILVRWYKATYFLVKKKHRLFDVRGPEETIDAIISKKLSICRYGDGEFDMVFHYINTKANAIGESFQTYDEDLARRLASILKDNDNKNCLVCIPYWFRSGGDYYVIKTQHFCRYYWRRNWRMIFQSVSLNKTYYDANISRFYLSYKDKSDRKQYVEKLKRIWQDRDVYFVEGEFSRLGVGNDLFSNALSIHRVLCPSVNAFSVYEQILEKIKQTVPKEALLILALGHTATVLAFDLSLVGYQALDLGHIDIEYEWMLMGANSKVPIPNKYVNEAGGMIGPRTIDDEKYQSEIVACVGL